jgi:hypothetical protein
LDLDGLWYWIEEHYGLDGKGPKKENASYSSAYQPFFTIFPQMWINEIKLS